MHNDVVVSTKDQESPVASCYETLSDLLPKTVPRTTAVPARPPALCCSSRSRRTINPTDAQKQINTVENISLLARWNKLSACRGSYEILCGAAFWPADGEVVTGTNVTDVVAKHAELFSSACALLVVYLLGFTKLIELNAEHLNVGLKDLPPGQSGSFWSVPC